MATHARADVVEQLREAILSGRIRPGDRLLRRHEALVRPAAADEHLGTIPADIAAITRAIVAGDAETARLLMRGHIEAWNRHIGG